MPVALEMNLYDLIFGGLGGEENRSWEIEVGGRRGSQETTRL